MASICNRGLLPFFYLILIAGFIAIPIAYYGLHQCLEDYPIQMSISWILFVLFLLAVLALAILTVSYRTMKAARANLVENLRQE